MKQQICNASYFAVVLSLFFNTLSLQASPIYQSPGPNLTFGDVIHGKGVVSGAVNPAAPAADQSLPHSITRGGMFAVGAGLEYGNIDELFDFIDQTADAFPPDDLEPPVDGPGIPDNLPSDPNFDDIIANNPELEELIDSVKQRATFLGSALALIAVEGYAKAFLTSDLPVLLSNDIWGGSLVFSANLSATSEAVGIVDGIEFEGEQAREALEAAIALGPNDPLTEFDLGGGLILTVDPGTGDFNLQFFNDSLLLTKAAKILEVSAGYSRLAFGNDRGNLYWGMKAKVYRAGLAQVDTRFGDLTDSEALFDDIRNADFSYDNALSLDVGAVWVGKNYTVGAAINDLFEPEFDFPAIDFTKYSNRQVLSQLHKGTVYQMDRQLRLQAGYFSQDGRWTLNLGLDANDIQDPMGDSYQWLTISAGYKTQKWWLPGARIGFRENLSGTGLQYVSAGITLFKYVDLDIAATLKSVEIDGKSLPRGANFSLGFEIVF